MNIPLSNGGNASCRMSMWNEAMPNHVYEHFRNRRQNFAILKLAVSSTRQDLLPLYEEKIQSHNLAIASNPFPDSGFDLFVPETAIFERDVESKFIDFRVKAEMMYCDTTNDTKTPCAYLIHPRSSISKTPLMLANHTGIIDAGYRGSLIGAFRWLRSTNSGSDSYEVEKNTRLTQICHPTLCPIHVTIVDENELSSTERGAGGFGSTGI